MNENISPSKDPSQSEVLYLLEKERRWMTSEEVRKKLNIDSRDKAAKFLRRLWDFNFLERRKREASVELEYKILEKNGQKDTD